MQVFKAFMKISKKHLPMALVYVAIFLVMALFLAGSDSAADTFTETKLKVNVIDEDNSPASKALTEYIGTKHTLVEVENEKDSILDALYYETANYVLIIKEGYEEKVAGGETSDLFENYQVHVTYGGTLFEHDLDAYVRAMSAYMKGGSELSEAISNTREVLAQNVAVEVVDFREDTSKSDYAVTYGKFFHYIPYIFISILITALCPVLIKMNEKEVRNRTNCSSLSTSKYTMQIFLGSAVFVFATWLIFMIVGMLFGKEMYSGKAWFAVLNSFVFVLVSAGIAILISVLVKGRQTVNLIANIVALGMCFLCGVVVPQNLLGEGVLRAARFLPAYWYIEVNDVLMESTGDIFDAGKCLTYIGIEAAFAVALFAIVLLVVKTKKEKKA